MSAFNLPDLGEGLQEAEIVEWHVAPGDTVEAGQTLVSVETDKAVVDIPSPHAGRIGQIHGSVGSQMKVGSPLVEFDSGTREDDGALVGRLPREESEFHTTMSAPSTELPRRVKATPQVRARARDLGIDLANVKATGSNGQVTNADLVGYSQRSEGMTAQPLRGARRAMARNMAQAHAEVAAATVTGEAVVPHWSSETDVTILLVKAAGAAAHIEPALNAWFDAAAMSRTVHDHADVGVAVDTPDGLYAPVLRGVQKRNAAALRDDLERVKSAIAEHTIRPEDLRDPTITVSNFGTIGGHHAALILMPPQVAILGAGAIAERVVPIDGQPAVRQTVPLSLTFDHRVVTGGEAARFLMAVIDELERQS
jgi:pyruvate dehydrogenase E2 component (dihydrolipoamide acetyltransferase)